MPEFADTPMEQPDRDISAALQVDHLARYFDVSPPFLNRLFEGIPRQILKAVDLMMRVDYLVAHGNEARLSRELLHLKADIEAVNSSTVCEKEELDLPVTGLGPVKIMKTVRMLIGHQINSIWKKGSTRQGEQTILAGP